MDRARWVVIAERVILAGTVGALLLPPFGGDASEIALAVAVVAWLIRGLLGRVWDIPRVAGAAVFALFAADLLRSALTSVDVGASMLAAQYYPLRLAAFVVGAAIVRRPRALVWLGWAAVAVFGACLLEGVVQRATGHSLLQHRGLDHGRVRLDFTHPNDVTLLVVLAPVAVAALLDGTREAAPRVQQAAWAAVAGVGATTALLVVLSGSRSGILAAGAAIGLVALASFRLPGLAATLGIGGTGAGLAWALNLGHLKERIAGAVSPPWDPRLSVWSVGLDMWHAHPVLGRGTGTYRLAYVETLASLHLPGDWQIYPEPIQHPHGLFMAALVERGAVGLLILVALVAVVGWACVRARRAAPRSWLPVGVAAAFAALTVAGVAEFWLGRRWVLVTLSALVGMACGLQAAGESDARMPDR